MTVKTLFLAAALVLPWAASAQQRAERRTVMLGAKNLVVTTNQNTVYYLVSSETIPVIDLTGDNVRIAGDEYDYSNIKSLRFHALSRHLFDEDSVTYDKTTTIDHGLLGLRRSLAVGRWNSLVLPVSLTSEQIIDTFGEGTEVASPRGIRENDVTVVEFQTHELTPGETVMKAGYHYLIRPTREADIASDSWTTTFLTGQRISGPIYLIPNVSTTTVKAPRLQSFASADETVSVYFRGSFLKLDDSVVSGSRIVNKRIDAGTYQLSDDARMVKNQEAAEVKAFTSWVQDMSSEKQEQLRFYVDGVNEDISEIADALPAWRADEAATTDDAVYDLGGRRVATAAQRQQLKPGVYVIAGKKVVIK